MCIKLHINNQFLYFLFFIPISLMSQGVLEFMLKTKFIIEIINSLSMCLLFIFYLYQSFTLKEKNIQIFNSKQNLCNKFLLITCCIIYHLNNLHLVNFNKNKYYEDIFYAGTFLLTDLLFFKKNIYSHHILSNIIMIITIFSLIYLNLYKINSIITLYYIILESFCYGFKYLIIYYLCSNYFINIYLIGSLMGLSELIYNIIYYKMNEEEIKIINNLPFLIFIFIIKFFYNFLYFLIIYNLSPIHAFLCYSLSSVIFSFIFVSREIFYILLGCFLIFSYLIYLEIIEIQCFGLNKNIKNKIIKRSNIELRILLADTSNSTSFYNSFT